MGLCNSKSVAGSVAGSPIATSPEHYPNNATEQTTPSRPSSAEASMSPSLHDLAALGSPRARRARSGTSASPSGSGIIAGQVPFPYSPSEPTLAAQLQNFIDALEHAERQGKQYPAAELDQKFQPQVVAAQNHIHPNLEVKVFDASASEPNALRQAIVNTRRGQRWRAVVNVERIHGKGAPSHGIAVDVMGGRGKVSVLAVDSVWGCTDTLSVMTAALKGVKNATLTILNTGTQKDVINCKTFALANAKAMADNHDLIVDLHKKNFRGKIVGTSERYHQRRGRHDRARLRRARCELLPAYDVEGRFRRSSRTYPGTIGGELSPELPGDRGGRQAQGVQHLHPTREAQLPA
nr:YopJ family acetyltransferase [Xanthomonas citri]